MNIGYGKPSDNLTPLEQEITRLMESLEKRGDILGKD